MEKTSIQPASQLDRVCTVVAGTSSVLCKHALKAELSMLNCDHLACALDESQGVTTLELTGWVGTRVEDVRGFTLAPESRVDLHTGHKLEATTLIL